MCGGLARFGSAPTAQQAAEFCKVCAHFFRQHPNQIVGQLCGHLCHIIDILYTWVGVHCTHGYNRTGFLIIAYLVEEDDWRYSPVGTRQDIVHYVLCAFCSLEAAISAFSKVSQRMLVMCIRCTLSVAEPATWYL